MSAATSLVVICSLVGFVVVTKVEMAFLVGAWLPMLMVAEDLAVFVSRVSGRLVSSKILPFGIREMFLVLVVNHSVVALAVEPGMVFDVPMRVQFDLRLLLSVGWLHVDVVAAGTSVSLLRRSGAAGWLRVWLVPDERLL